MTPETVLGELLGEPSESSRSFHLLGDVAAAADEGESSRPQLVEGLQQEPAKASSAEVGVGEWACVPRPRSVMAVMSDAERV